ncbi:hypothetical protein JYU34_005768 [Plutella xylostella]|uniref:Uncharacterized protein n=1 Tax=Plutella xylostella TaxID=51655 RepID=A0ABQ7QU23_PLUXY|nr:hypothetical protein JYU34_005768 [Plutella xylostella]
MVRLTSLLSRIPTIKFRKGGVAGAAPSAAGQAQAGAPSPASHSSKGLSTSTISDIELPKRYQRRPLSQEEIDHINGGGIRDAQTMNTDPQPLPKTDKTVIIKVPRGTLFESCRNTKDATNVSIVVEKVTAKRS